MAEDEPELLPPSGELLIADEVVPYVSFSLLSKM